MIGIMLLVCILAVFGFILSWITGVVANEEVEIKTSMLILFLNGVVTVIVGLVLADLVDPMVAWLARLTASLITLMLLIRYLGGVSGKHSIIIAVVFSILINALLFGLTMMLSK